MRTVSEQEASQHLKNLTVYGYTKVEGLLDKGEVRAAFDKLQQSYEKVRNLDRKGVPERDVKDKIVYNLQNKDKMFIDLLVNPFVRKTLMAKLNDQFYRFMPPELPNYTLIYYNARSSGNELPLHIDSWIPAPGPYTWMMQVAFILEDQDEENGCTIVVPGSHVSGTFTDRDLKKIEPVYSKAGDVVMWDSRTWHGALGSKNENRTRWSLIATMSAWWLKQVMDITRSMPDEIYQQLSDEQKALMGFCSIPPYDETERINTKCDYTFLKKSVKDYYKRP